MDLGVLNSQKASAALNSSTADSNASKFFRAKEGSYKLRLANKWDDNPFSEAILNYRLREGGKPVVLKDENMLKKHAFEYWEKDIDKNSKKYKLFRALLPTTRYYTHIIDANNPEGGVLIYSMSKAAYTQLLDKTINLLEENEDPLEYNFILKVTKGALFNESAIDFERKPSKIECDYTQEDLTPLDSIHEYDTQETVDELVKAKVAQMLPYSQKDAELAKQVV